MNEERKKEMNKQELVKKIKGSLEMQTTEQLKEMARLLMTNYEDGAIIVFNFVLDVLESRMPESEYVEFCDNL